MAEEIIFPDANKRSIKTLRFLNILDDEHNVISWTKVHLICSDFAGATTIVGTIFSWITGHWDTLTHAITIAPIVGGYMTHAHAMHLMDKNQRNSTRIALEKKE